MPIHEAHVLRIAVSVALLLSASSVHGEEDYEALIRKLATAVTQAETDAVERALETAGLKAFPSLIRHFNDETPVADQANTKDVIRLGPIQIGEVCFDILHYQIEDNWAKGFRQYYAITHENAQRWLADRPGQTIQQLRKAAAAESLKKAETDLAQSPDDEFLQRAVQFLRQNKSKRDQEK